MAWQTALLPPSFLALHLTSLALCPTWLTIIKVHMPVIVTALQADYLHAAVVTTLQIHVSQVRNPAGKAAAVVGGHLSSQYFVVPFG